MPRSSPFADVTGGPAPDAVVVEIGRPTRAALGCVGVAALFLAVLALAALSYSAFGARGPASAPASLRPVAAVLGCVFGLIVVGLAVVALSAVRVRQGLAFDAAAVWWRADGELVRLPWSDLAAARLVTPTRIRGQRTSTPKTPAVELCPVDEATLLGYPARHPRLADRITGGEPVSPGLPALRFAFRLGTTGDADPVAAAIARFAPEQWAAGNPPPSVNTDSDARPGGDAGPAGRPFPVL